MGAQGTAVLDFGTWPGKNDTTVDVAAAGVVSTSLVEAWIRPVATADHSVDEHIVETLKVVGAYLSDDNIRIYGMNVSQIFDPDPDRPEPMIAGLWNVAWVWN